MEFIGTFFLVLTIGLTLSNPALGELAPLAIGSVLIAMVYCGGPISNAHYNPAVTLGIYLSGNCCLKDFFYYVFSQLTGALLAAVITLFLYGSMPAMVPVSWPKALLAEGLFTFGLVFVILNVAFSKRSKGNEYYGIAIGLIVVGSAYVVGSLSGSLLNPAVALAGVLMGLNNIFTLVIYTAVHCLAAIIACKIFQLITNNFS